MKRPALFVFHSVLLLCVALSTASAASARKTARPGSRFTPARELTILDQNVYVGTEFTAVLGLDPTDPNYNFLLLAGVAEVYQTLVTSDYPARAAALADQIQLAKPDLVTLQEASLLRRQSPGDFVLGGMEQATEVELDYVALLLDALKHRGLQYVMVAVVTNMDLELPMMVGAGSFDDVRLTDRDVILARAGQPPGQFRIKSAQSGSFETALPLPLPGLSIKRGWAAVDVFTQGRTVRVINAHLEENTSPEVQLAQGAELIAGPAATTLPVILVGDYNSDANGNDGTATYSLLTDSFEDAWSVAHPGTPGLTWGHDPLLTDPSVDFVWRLDLVLFRGPLKVLSMSTFSPQIGSARPMWLSDHGGLLVRFGVN